MKLFLYHIRTMSSMQQLRVILMLLLAFLVGSLGQAKGRVIISEFLTVNDKGLVLNPQTQMAAMWALSEGGSNASPDEGVLC